MLRTSYTREHLKSTSLPAPLAVALSAYQSCHHAPASRVWGEDGGVQLAGPYCVPGNPGSGFQWPTAGSASFLHVELRQRRLGDMTCLPQGLPLTPDLSTRFHLLLLQGECPSSEVLMLRVFQIL